MKFRFFSLLYVLLIFTLHVQGKELSWETQEEGFSIHLVLSNDQLSMGDELNIQLLAQYPIDYSIDPNQIIQNVLWHMNPLQPHWQIVQQKIQFNNNPNNQSHQLTLDLRLRPLDIGPVLFSLFSLPFTSADPNQTYHMLTPIFNINIHSSVNTEDLYTHLPLVPLTPEFPISLNTRNSQALFDTNAIQTQKIHTRNILLNHSFPWLFIISTLVGTCLFLFWLYFRKKPQQSMIPINFKEESLKALDRLSQSNLIEKKQYQEFYYQLTAIVRNYLEQQFHLPMTAQTTEEFLRRSEAQSEFSPSIQKALAQFLSYADQVKFAKHQPTLEEFRQSYHLARQIVSIESRD